MAGSCICPLPEAPPWGFVNIFWPHHVAFATLKKNKTQMPDKCPTNARPGGGGDGGMRVVGID